MNRTAFALVATLFLATYALSATPARAAQAAGGKLSVSAAFTPDPPSSKGNDKIVVTVRNAAGTPVRGATVKIATNMPTMSMRGADMIAHDSGNGTYTAHAKLAYPTRWAFDISAEAKGQHGATHLERELK